MTRYEATLDLPDGNKLFAKAVVLRRGGEEYETDIKHRYVETAFMCPKSAVILDGVVMIRHDLLGLGTMKILKVDEKTSMLLVNGYDETLVDDAIIDFMDVAVEANYNAKEKFYEALSRLKNASDAAQMLLGGNI